MSGHATPRERQMRVIWQAPTREFCEVGELTLPPDGQGMFRFRYADTLPSAFHGFLAFPDRERVYESSSLFPFFATRVMSASRPDFDHHLAALGLSRGEATAFEILSRTAGELPTDTVQIVPHAEEHDDGSVTQIFLASGVRYFADRGVEDALASLHLGDRLTLRDAPENDFDSRAILINTIRDEPVGYVPSYLLDLVHKLRGERHLDVRVVRANGPSVPWHLRLLCSLEATTHLPEESEASH
jgi:hypothetical protein